MAGDDANRWHGAGRMDRRAFLRAAGSGILTVSGALVLSRCGGGTTTPTEFATGRVRGTVSDASGHPQAVGRIYLLDDTGLNNNQYADVAADGTFDFGPVPAGAYQANFWGANLASVPEPYPNPVRITVSAGLDSVVKFTVQLGAENQNARDIYIGDYFYQEEPYGLPNGTVIVPVGTLVCWYNVGRMIHTVTGGPWGDSGPMALDANFNWYADQVGTFPYRCTFHAPQMQAVLQVTSS